MGNSFSPEVSTLINVLEVIFSSYVIVLITIYSLRAVTALIANIKYKRRADKEAPMISQLAKSPLVVGVSIIAPAYNESCTIVDNIRSLLMIDYPSFEVIIVNDGSKDDSMAKVIKEFRLEKVDLPKTATLYAQPIRGVYTSKRPAFGKLVLINKENGGKADALNAGIMYAKHPIIGCMDVDSIMTKDALIKLARPFMMDAKVIATGSAIRIANSCQIEHGFLTKVFLPKGFFERFQVIEYLRAFLMGRMSMSMINGLTLVSGASGLFKKSIVLDVGGYLTGMVGEDIELLIRMRRYCYDNKIAHKVTYIPDPVCWTEAPTTYSILEKQRNRWSRGSVEALWIHRKMIFNPKYGVVGLYGLPYWLLYEMLNPIFIFFGLIFIGAMLWAGYYEPVHVGYLILLSYTFSVMLSTLSLLIEEITFRQYTKVRDILTIYSYMLLEIIIYQPLNVYWSLSGIWDKITGKNTGWGVMTRTGFKKAA